MTAPSAKEQRNLLAFLQNANVIVLRTQEEYERFLDAMARHGIPGLVGREPYRDLIRLFEEANSAAGPGRKFLDWDGNTLYAECQIGKGSIGIYPYSAEATVEWYGTEPMRIDDIAAAGFQWPPC